jgi:hypothetical protein
MRSVRTRAAIMAAFNRNRDGPEIAQKTIQGGKPNRILRVSFILDEDPDLWFECSVRGPSGLLS